MAGTNQLACMLLKNVNMNFELSYVTTNLWNVICNYIVEHHLISRCTHALIKSVSLIDIKI